MSEAHKQALAQGRRESRAIKAYLESMAARRPGRPPSRETLQKRLATVAAALETETNPLKRVDLHQRQIETEARLGELERAADNAALEAGFIDAAQGYSERKGISYAAWRAAGVPAGVLRKAGISRTD